MRLLMASLFQKDIRYLKGVGNKRVELFSKLHVSTVGALLLFYPRTYEDWSAPLPIASAPINEPCCIKATVVSGVSKSRIKQNMTLYKLKVTDGFTVLPITFFNNPYVADKLIEGKEFLFFGRISYHQSKREMLSPQFEDPSSNMGFHPVYKQTSGLTSRQIASCVKNAIALLPEQVNDPIPKEIRQKYQLCSLRFAIENIHFPANERALKEAKKRLSFEELLMLQLGLSLLRKKRHVQNGTRLKTAQMDSFYQLLPFSPTDAQIRTIKECLHDMKEGTSPMCRLVQGDVGSGKTAVAAAVCYAAIKNQMQVAFMAPTEILAEQHYNWFKKLFAETGINIALLTGSTRAPEKKKIKSALTDGAIDLIIGTHALLSDDVSFLNLGLVITDEQHRFGVSQRAALSCKGQNPHLLVMSATPIPRTLALIIYGDLDLSVLDERPPGRQKIDTFAIDTKKRQRMFGFLKKLIKEGRQGYIVCPLVEENENSLVSAEEYYKKIKAEEFKQFHVGMIHGKMSASKKEIIMNSFSKGEIDLLISTTVIEVGVDVPNAAFMVIENAERFGLSQLHQLRGRVGRGSFKSFCILVSDAQNEEALRRLQIMTETNDGFRIADKDLKLRGPGDFFGSRQHGLPDLKIADMITDMALLLQAQEAAKQILSEDSDLSFSNHRGLLFGIKRLFQRVGETRLN